MAWLEDYQARNLSQLKGFGEEVLGELQFTGWLDWFVSFRDPREIWKAQPTYLISEMTYIVVALLTFIHSRRVGGRFKYLWWAILFHGIVVECVSYWTRDIDSFWHSQTTIVFIGRRLPIHIMLVYPVFIYNSVVAVSRMKLPIWAEPWAVGLGVILIDVPYDMTAVKYLHWTWHDTDPNIYDRFYWVPWNSYYFHSTFAASLIFAFHGWRRLIIGKTSSGDRWEAGSSRKEWICVVLSAFCGMPGGVLQFIPIYHPLHDIGGVHTENCMALLALTFLLVAWSADRNPSPEARRPPGVFKGFNELVLGLILHYSCYLCILAYFDPENEVSIGVHEKIGPCDEYMPVQTAFGMALQKRRYLCPTDYDEGYFDFHCLPGGKHPSMMAKWYTACGTPFINRVEYFMVVGGTTWIAFLIFWNLHFRSATEVAYKEVESQKNQRKVKSK